MKHTHSLTQLLYHLWQHISPRRRVQFGFLLFLMVFTSFAEIISIGAVLPFLGVLTAPTRIFEHPAAQPIIQIFELTSANQLLLPLTITFGLAAIFAGAMRILLVWSSTRLTYATGADLSISIYRRTLYQPYAVHVARNSSEIINGITGKTSSTIGIILMILNFIGSSIMMIAIMVALVSLEPVIAITAFAGFGSIYGCITWLTSSRLLRDSQLFARESTQLIKSLQEGLGGIRDVLIDGTQSVYCQIYRNADLPLRRAQGNIHIVATCPRYAIESLGMILIAALAYVFAQQPEGIINAIPVLGTMVLGAQRLLPALQQGYAAWSSIKGGQASLQDTLDLLDQPLPSYASQSSINKSLSFRQSINLKQLSFRYSKETPWVLKKINLIIPKGSRIGFIGTTGSGKSTMLDIIMGLLQPTEGTLEIDGQPITEGNHRAWQTHIAHVPQTIFLADTSIEENIALGVSKDKIDHERVRQAAHQAQIADIIETWPKQYQTFVGERGVRLSGGQRQRIGIARALYKQADVIIFDEATSALDNETEQAVMHAIEGLSEDLTILIIAHRITTLKNCTQVIELGDAGIKRIGTYQDIITSEQA